VDKVVKLELVEVGDGMRLDAITVLDAAKNERFERMLVIGRTEDGELYIAATANAGESLVLLEHAKHQIIFGRDGMDE
jgi:hypothetical protein